MATAEYHRKQVELLLVWAMATAEPVLKAKLLSRALQFLARIDDADDRLLRLFQEVLAESIFLSSPKEEFESRGYYEKPAHLSKVG